MSIKILLDECIDRRLAREFSGYKNLEVETVQSMKWNGVKNGKLLALATAHFDVFITVDQNMQYEQNLKQFDLIILVLATFSNRLIDLKVLVPQILQALETAEKGKATLITNQSES